MKNQVSKIKRSIIMTTIFMVIFLVFEAYMISLMYVKGNFCQIVLICVLSLMAIYFHRVSVKVAINRLWKRKQIIDKIRGMYRIEKVFDMMDAQEKPDIVVDYYNVHIANFSAFEGFEKLSFLKKRIELYAQLKNIQAEADYVFNTYPESLSKLMKLTKLAERKESIDKEAHELSEQLEKLAISIKNKTA